MHHEPIDQIVEATAIAAYTQNPDCSAEVFEKEQKVAFQELMAKDLRKWGAPDKALEKLNLLPNREQPKYLCEVQNRLEAYCVQEQKESASKAEEKFNLKDTYKGLEEAKFIRTQSPDLAHY